MSATFILQGLTPQNHISAGADVMQVDGIERVLISVAFVSSTGVDLLASHIRPHAARTTTFIGIRNGITSAQAIKALLDLGVDLKAVDTGSAHLVFHPKLYYARGSTAARLLVGSANLTTGGLNNNIEASVAVALDLSSPEDSELARSVEEQFDELSTKHSANVSAFPEGIALTALLADPRLVDERTAPARTVSRLVLLCHFIVLLMVLDLQAARAAWQAADEAGCQAAPYSGDGVRDVAFRPDGRRRAAGVTAHLPHACSSGLHNSFSGQCGP